MKVTIRRTGLYGDCAHLQQPRLTYGFGIRPCFCPENRCFRFSYRGYCVLTGKGSASALRGTPYNRRMRDSYLKNNVFWDSVVHDFVFLEGSTMAENGLIDSL